jgi:hypothetical protein
VGADEWFDRLDAGRSDFAGGHRFLC